MTVALFSRRKRAEDPGAETAAVQDGSAQDGSVQDGSVQDGSAPAGADDELWTQEEDRAHLGGGPYDADAAPEEDRVDLGGLQVPMVQGLELRLDMDQSTRAVTGVTLVQDGTSLQLQAFAAPKSRGLWDEVRASLRDSVVGQGGTAETREGPFGTELLTRLPVKKADGRIGYRPARFIGVDGPRWFVRGILSGRALTDPERASAFEAILSRIVVVRGAEAMAPQELIPLNLPGQRPGLVPAEDPIDPLGRGPEIAEVR